MRLIYCMVTALLLGGCGGSYDNSPEAATTTTLPTTTTSTTQLTSTTTTKITTTTTTTTTTSTSGQPFTTLGYSSGGGIPYTNTEPPTVIVYRNATDFANYWMQMNPSPYGPALPSVNFNENIVLSAVDKTYPNDGDLIKITRIDPSSSGVTVYATQVHPGKNCIFLTWFAKPYHIVSTSTFSGYATLSLSQTTVDCPPAGSGNGRLKLSDIP